MHYFLADRQARLSDPKASALLLDLEGHITETSTANFLIVADGQVVSPTRQKILPGISLAVVAELCQELGIRFIDRDLRPEDVIHVQEALVTSTPYCLGSVTRINGNTIGNGQPGPVADRLLTAWDGLVGVNIRRQVHEGAARRRAAIAVTAS
jgi:branched-subunit amino acid aminotransferase/4-amino-4-deoxychorismate lyase